MDNEINEKIEQIQNLVDNYKSAQSYMEDNYEKLSNSELQKLQEKQENRRIQIENMSENISDELVNNDW